MDSRELPVDRLTTTDESGRRIYVEPADVRGRWRNFRTVLELVLLAFFLVLPWIRIDGRQAVWLDLANRRFQFFGFLFWAHDAPRLVFLFGGFAVGLALVTAIWGRVWCGYACPQTVFVDLIYRRIERWIEGDHIARKRLNTEPLSRKKLLKRGSKWLAFLVVSLVISHSFVAYFTGTEALARMITHPPLENLGTFLTMLGFTALTLFDFGWFREQFCTIACPYGRLQSVLMDDHSQVVYYDAKRGEPRKGVTPEPGQAVGDCVNCFRCVAVCPTGIDIRRGVQMECIACTSCMDACDEVMTKVHKPKGLIRYDRIAPGRFTARTLLYVGILLIIGAGMVVSVMRHEVLDLELIRGVEAPYQEITGPKGEALVVNHFHGEVSNQDFDDIALTARVPEPWASQGVELVASNFPAQAAAGQMYRVDLFFKVPKALFQQGKSETALELVGRSSKRTVTLQREVKLIGPYR